MKIAALIQAHHRPQQLSQLLQRLNGPLWQCYVHIDQKADAAAFTSLDGQAKFTARRIRVSWGGFSMVEAIFTLMRESFADSTITHFYLMSGQCWPISTDARIAAHIGALPIGGANLMEISPMPENNKPLNRYTQRWAYDIRSPILRKCARRIFPFLPGKPLSDLRGIRLHGSSSWWLLDRAAVEKILAFIDENPWFLRLFRLSGCADEVVFHSLVASLDIPVSGPSPTVAKWMKGKANPEIMTPEIYEELKTGPALFARKFLDFIPA